jgi:hypothetical protein|uniref:Uncharacterized protein n=1 Tax=Bacteriophage sp. TaxID=38018 RepID=A0A8D9PEP6_9VIRU|nr:MAG TPA: hypothetical protein [Bacteriophage sp.]
MLTILCFISGLFFIALVVFVCYLAYIIYKDEDYGYKNTITDWIKEYRKDWRSWAHLKFNDWKKYYILAPHEWELKWFAPCRTVRTKTGNWGNVYINFGFIGNIKYVFFKYDMKNKRKKEEFNKNSQDSLRYVLEAVQGDIEEIQKKAEEETNKAKKEIDKIRESYLNKEIELKSTDRWEN